MPDYIGYCENLPNLRGRIIRIPKGAMVYSTAPTGARPCARAHSVRVHSVDNGMEIAVAREYGDILVPVASGRDMEYVLRKNGLEVPGEVFHNLTPELVSDLIQNLEPLGVVRRVGNQIRVITQNPRLVWVGSGQYYRSTDINNVSF